MDAQHLCLDVWTEFLNLPPDLLHMQPSCISVAEMKGPGVILDSFFYQGAAIHEEISFYLQNITRLWQLLTTLLLTVEPRCLDYCSSNLTQLHPFTVHFNRTDWGVLQMCQMKSLFYSEGCSGSRLLRIKAKVPAMSSKALYGTHPGCFSDCNPSSCLFCSHHAGLLAQQARFSLRAVHWLFLLLFSGTCHLFQMFAHLPSARQVYPDLIIFKSNNHTQTVFVQLSWTEQILFVYSWPE